ncbi:MAG: hypothetical protein VX610_03920 [SAR324 cluster bacterium]|nr:hypothetical protein [SAR324 cluster bacterium]
MSFPVVAWGDEPTKPENLEIVSQILHARTRNMELTISDEKTKEIFTEIFVDLAKTKRSVLYEIVLEALEEVGLANAIAEGRKNDFVTEDQIFAILEDSDA